MNYGKMKTKVVLLRENIYAISSSPCKLHERCYVSSGNKVVILSGHIQGVPGGMCQTLGDCSVSFKVR